MSPYSHYLSAADRRYLNQGPDRPDVSHFDKKCENGVEPAFYYYTILPVSTVTSLMKNFSSDT